MFFKLSKSLKDSFIAFYTSTITMMEGLESALPYISRPKNRSLTVLQDIFCLPLLQLLVNQLECGIDSTHMCGHSLFHGLLY